MTPQTVHNHTTKHLKDSEGDEISIFEHSRLMRRMKTCINTSKNQGEYK
jgi:hypothetical protein